MECFPSLNFSNSVWVPTKLATADIQDWADFISFHLHIDKSLQFYCLRQLLALVLLGLWNATDNKESNVFPEIRPQLQQIDGRLVELLFHLVSSLMRAGSCPVAFKKRLKLSTVILVVASLLSGWKLRKSSLRSKRHWSKTKWTWCCVSFIRAKGVTDPWVTPSDWTST